MSTRSTIAIQNQDGSITAIYCHWDGYLEGVSATLVQHWNTEEKVRALLAMGDLSSLGTEIGEKHAFDEADSKWCTFYGRDRNGKNHIAHQWQSVEQWLTKFGQEYNYLFKDGTWLCFDRDGIIEAGWQSTVRSYI